MTSLATTARLRVALQDCNVDLDRIGDGICENSLNILACLYDGGDCCESYLRARREGASDSTCFDPAACENIPTCDLKCEDVSCATPPAPYCQDGLVVTFASEGTCRDGACSYTPTLEACADGTTCTFGACRAAEDTCADLTCDTPPLQRASMTRPLPCRYKPNLCRRRLWRSHDDQSGCPSGVCSEGACAENAQCSAEAGTLGDGTCQTANNSAACNFDGGDCCPSTCSGSCEAIDTATCSDPHASENDGCANLACDAPEETCNVAQDAILSYESAQCIAGTCVYLEVSNARPEAWLCNNATCVDVSDPCALVTCDSPLRLSVQTPIPCALTLRLEPAPMATVRMKAWIPTVIPTRFAPMVFATPSLMHLSQTLQTPQ